jgi:hypothetical protein
MRPEISGDLDDSGAEDLVNLAQFDGKINSAHAFSYFFINKLRITHIYFSMLPADESNDVYEASLSPSTISDLREHANQTKVDANFFNKFDDDFDESDMKPSA